MTVSPAGGMSSSRLVFGGAAPVSFARLKTQVFQKIEAFLPVTLAPGEAETVSVQEIQKRRRAHFEAWLKQFRPADRPTALLFLDKLRYIDHPRLLGHLRQAHQRLLAALEQDGFLDKSGADPLSKVAFTTLYRASSGDIISYLYRKTNGIPKVKFHDQWALATDGQDKSQQALIIVDDYLATGAQFFCEALGHGDALHHQQNKHLPHLVNAYKKVYFVVAGAHQKALQRFQTLQAGKTDDAVKAILEGYQELDNARYETPVKNRLKQLRPNQLELIHSFVEHPLLSEHHPGVSADERSRLREFLTRYNVYKYPFGVGHLEGNTVFYYSTPNNLPDLLWNTKARALTPQGVQDASRPWLPLFHRLEDISAYWSVQEKQIPIRNQLW